MLFQSQRMQVIKGDLKMFLYCLFLNLCSLSLPAEFVKGKGRVKVRSRLMHLRSDICPVSLALLDALILEIPHSFAGQRNICDVLGLKKAAFKDAK